MRGYATIDIAVKELNDLRAALRPPDLGGGDGLAVVQHERVGQGGIRIGF